MPWFQEVTEWSGNTPNHFYLLSEGRDRLYAYAAKGQKKAKVLSQPVTFDQRGRRFRAVEDQWKVKIQVEPKKKSQGKTWKVTGSRGDTYTVTQEGNRWDCTCSGFKFRGKCRHVDEKRG